MAYTEYSEEPAIFAGPVSSDDDASDKYFEDSHKNNGQIFNASSYSGQYVDKEDEFLNELLKFNQFWDSLLKVLEPFEITLLAFGFVGNLFAFVTLFHSKRMCTPSFLYHRALVEADLLFCTNFFLNLFIDRLTSVECKQHIYRYRFAAFYSATINPFVNSLCAYTLLYATLAVTLDRLIALSIFKSYQLWNRREIALLVIIGSIGLSITFHSWTTFIQNTVIEYRLDRDTNDTSLIWKPCWNDQVVYHWVKRDHLGETYEKASEIKRIYNAALRITYPLLLACMTLGIVGGLVQRNRRKQRLRQTSGMATLTRNISPATRRRHRCEQALFLLTISVLILAFLQVASSEGRRILQFTYPAAEIIKTKVDNAKLSMNERLANFRWVLYAHQTTRALANFCTVVERSAICFLYVATNKLFRSELFLMLSTIFVRGRRGLEFRRRFDSDARSLKTTSTTDEEAFIRRQSNQSMMKRNSIKMVRKFSDKRRSSGVSLLLFGTT